MSRRMLWLAAVAAPAVLILALIATRGVNVPQHDQWDLVRFFREDDAGTLGVGDFFAQHNEHRPALPTAVDFGLAQLTDWDVRVELFVNFAVALATAVFLLLVLARSLGRVGYVLAPLVALIFFSPRQWESWLWGWQLEWFLSNGAALTAFWALTSLIDRSRRWGLAVGVAGALVATFSLGQGLLVWPVGLGLLVLRRCPWRLWTVLWIAVTAAYFIGYDDPDNHPSKTLFLEEPIQFGKYVGLYVGSAFGANDATGGLAGVVVLAAFVGAVAYLVAHRRDRELLDRSVFWLATGAYCLGAALMTGVSRLGFGWAQAGTSRYTTMAGLFGIATLCLLVAGPARRRVALVAVPLLLAILVNTARGLDEALDHADRLDAAAACLRSAQSVDDPCLRSRPLGVTPQRFETLVYLRSRGWAGF